MFLYVFFDGLKGFIADIMLYLTGILHSRFLVHTKRNQQP